MDSNLGERVPGEQVLGPVLSQAPDVPVVLVRRMPKLAERLHRRERRRAVASSRATTGVVRGLIADRRTSRERTYRAFSHHGWAQRQSRTRMGGIGVDSASPGGTVATVDWHEVARVRGR